MPAVTNTNISDVRINASFVSSLRVGSVLAWERATQVVTYNISGQPFTVPTWAVAISVALIGGGGGGQSGNGSSNSSGRPGGAAQWSVFYRELNRQPGDVFTYSVVVGSGGAGGGNSDHAYGSNGTKSSLKLFRRQGSASTEVATYNSGVGLAGPASGLGVGAISGSPNTVSAPRRAYTAPSTLPRGTSVGKETVGGSPGAGGGYGGGGYFGSRGRGAAGGNGRVIVYCYGAP